MHRTDFDFSADRQGNAECIANHIYVSHSTHLSIHTITHVVQLVHPYLRTPADRRESRRLAYAADAARYYASHRF